MPHIHWTRGRIAVIGLLILVVFGLALWGWAAADAGSTLVLSELQPGARTMANTDFDLTITADTITLADQADITPENAMAYVIVFGGNDSDLEQASQDGAFGFNKTTLDGRVVCRQGQDFANYNGENDDFVYFTSLDLASKWAGFSYTFPVNIAKEGPAHIYAVIAVYDGSIDTIQTQTTANDMSAFCLNNAVTKVATAKSFNIEKSWGCDSGICIVNVNPQVLPQNEASTSYQIYLSGLDAEKDYGFISGRHELEAVASNEAMCRAILSGTAGSSQDSLFMEITGDVGSAYQSGGINATFSNGAAVRRIVGFLFEKDKDEQWSTGADICSQMVSAAGWLYDKQTGQGSGKTDQSTKKETNSSGIDTSGGFAGVGELTDQPTGTGSGSFLSGICSSGSNITLQLSKSQGSINFSAAGLMGLCTLNVGGQVLKLLLILAALFFVISLIVSGITMMRATDLGSLEHAKKTVIGSAIGAALIVLANWIVPMFISLVYNLFT